jgi:carboxypeptidase PM20D1
VETVDDERVQIRLLAKKRNPSLLSRTDTPGWNTLARTIREVMPRGTVVAPYLVPGGTDARHYRQLSESTYRFAPFALDRNAATMVHGTNEHIPVAGYAQGVRFYHRLIQNAQEL